MKEKFDSRFSNFQGNCNTLLYNFYHSLLGDYYFPEAEINRLRKENGQLQEKIKELQHSLDLHINSDKSQQVIDLYIDDFIDKLDRHEPKARLKNSLKAENIYTVNDLLKKTKTELGCIPNLGKRSLRSLIMLLDKYKLTLMPTSITLDDILTKRDIDILLMRTASFPYKRNHTLKECAEKWNISSTRVRQIENKSFWRLRHPDNRHLLILFGWNEDTRI